MREDARLATDARIATKPAVRAVLSRPGNARNVTDALRIMAD